MRAVALRLLCLLAAARGSELPGSGSGSACAPGSGSGSAGPPLGATCAPGRGRGRGRGRGLEPAGAARPRAKRGFTYPGTLWCGAGNNAESYEQLGEHRETDKCCREHDHCEHVIHPFTYQYGYRNLRWHTISHCACDRRLKGCLQRVNDTASRVVGQAFFNVIQVPCFEFSSKEQCVEPYLYLWCKKYHTVAVAVAREPVLYEFGGELIDGGGTGLAGTASGPAPHPSTPLPPPKLPAPGPAVTRARGSFWKPLPLRPQPQSPGGSKRKGQGKKRERKKERGKGLRRKNAHFKAEVPGLPAQPADAATLFPKPLGRAELGPEPLDIGGRDDTFNAVLNDAPVAEDSLAPPGPAPDTSSAQGHGEARPSPVLSPTRPARSRRRGKARAGRKHPRQKAKPQPL
ncbi:protein PROCA1 [Carettochelys insculpta]|uniref:protein PROCA1 n=1 Tax=Carettochelys insculpta TaxID=44489 RepID=UPI003EB9F6EF